MGDVRRQCRHRNGVRGQRLRDPESPVGCLGRTGIVVKVDSGASRNDLSRGASPLKDDRHEVPLLAEHELRMAFGRSKQRLLIYNVEKEPAVVKRFSYYRDDGSRACTIRTRTTGPARERRPWSVGSRISGRNLDRNQRAWKREACNCRGDCWSQAGLNHSKDKMAVAARNSQHSKFKAPANPTVFSQAGDATDSAEQRGLVVMGYPPAADRPTD